MMAWWNPYRLLSSTQSPQPTNSSPQKPQTAKSSLQSILSSQTPSQNSSHNPSSNPSSSTAATTTATTTTTSTPSQQQILTQTRSLEKATLSLRKQSQALEKNVTATTAQLKNYGDLQTWAEVVWRDIFVLERTIEILDGDGDGDDEDNEEGLMGGENEDGTGAGGQNRQAQQQ